jgi:multidrug efflux pump subunit AcrA (membrane-fusion protein)
MIKRISAAVLVVGLAIALYAALTTSAEAPEPELEGQPPTDPFEVSIAATGIVEAASENVEIAAPVGGLVMSVPADVGAEVVENDPLFTLDARDLEAERLRQQATLDQRLAELERLRAQPRDEEIPAARAEVARLDALAADAADELAAVESAFEQQAASEREVSRARLQAQAARAAAERAAADLELLLAGAWAQDIAVAQAGVEAARAQLRATERLIERRTVRAPFAGTVLKRNIEPGEYARPNQTDPPIVLGDLSSLHVRAQVNESDLAAINRIRSAIARPRGRASQRIELEFLEVEPLAIPKRQLTGAPAELIDTRVVDFLFEAPANATPRLYPGQLVDVFIELEPKESEGEDEGDESGGESEDS